jgi:tripartite-type tricarboxylate transporter receptor subunit TctC
MTGLRAAAASAIAFLILTAPPVRAQESVATFYKGKSISLLIGSSAGGGYDTYARLLARHIGKYIPGNPTVVPSNMPGAGGNLAAGHIYNIAPKDGTVMALVLPGTVTEPLFKDREKVKHDPAKLTYIGSANSEVNMCYLRADTGVQSIKDLQTKEVVIGASAEGGSTRDQPALQSNLLGSKFRIVSGYPGSREIFLAIEKGEVSGICGLGLPAFRQARADWLENGFVRIVSQDNAKGDPKITAMGVPRTVDLAKTPDDRRIMELVYAQQEFGRPFIMPPNVPADRVAALRKAFMQALNDKDLLAEAEKLKIDISPVEGSELQELVEKVYATPPALVERARQALVYHAP